VVPKATHKQFKNDFMDIYPYAKVLFPQEDDFTKEKRPEFEARAITGVDATVASSWGITARTPTTAAERSAVRSASEGRQND
jgi:N12 class adenine-specific DNA methylase